MVGRGGHASGQVGHASGLGTIREYRADASDDLIELIKTKARVVSSLALKGGAREAGVLWVCAECSAPDNIAWHRCIGCGSKFPEDGVRAAKKSAHRVLQEPHDLAKATAGNPYRLGAIAGYGLGRIQAVAEDGDRPHPAAFGTDHVAIMPPRPPKEACSLPDQRVLAIKVVAYGAAAWPDDSE